MRIIAGRFKGMRLRVPRGTAVRPTTDRVREAVFSAIAPVLEDSRVLELFAGTGSFGFEALSRGAESAVFVESDRKAASAIAAAAQTLGVEAQATVLRMPAMKALRTLAEQGGSFRIVFLDPPYDTGWIERVMHDPLLPDLVESGGLVVVECGIRSRAVPVPLNFGEVFSRRYGDTSVVILGKKEMSDANAQETGRSTSDG